MAKRFFYAVDPPWHEWPDVEFIELMHTTFTLYCLYLNDMDPADIGTYMGDVMDLPRYREALDCVEDIIYAIPSIEAEHLDGSCDRDYFIHIRRHGVVVEIIEYEQDDERHELSDLYRRHQGDL